MRRPSPLSIAILLIIAVGLYLGWRIYGPGEMGRFGPVTRAQHAPSALYARMLVHYDAPPILEEEYRLSDVEGVSTFSYRIRSYAGHQITITAPPARVYDVSFMFGKLNQDGIWQLTNKPPRPGSDKHYTVYVRQLADFKEGTRTVTFTNPKYWATAAGRQYAIDLSKQKPMDLLHLQSTALADPRYLQIVDDFRSFGPAEFRRNVARAQARVRAGHF